MVKEMKLADLGLKTKPATKYFPGGWVAFKTDNQNLFFEIKAVGKTFLGKLTEWEPVKSKDQLDSLLSIKKMEDTMELLD